MDYPLKYQFFIKFFEFSTGIKSCEKNGKKSRKKSFFGHLSGSFK
jgi:hypothetical protein